MDAPGDDRFFTELRGCTAALARIIDGDLERPVPTCPGWAFRQLATHVGRGHRWAAQIVATRQKRTSAPSAAVHKSACCINGARIDSTPLSGIPAPKQP